MNLRSLLAFLRDDRTLHLVIVLGVLARRRAPMPLKIGGVLLVIGVQLSAAQCLLAVAAFALWLVLEHLAHTYAPQPAAARPAPVAGGRP